MSKQELEHTQTLVERLNGEMPTKVVGHMPRSGIREVDFDWAKIEKERKEAATYIATLLSQVRQKDEALRAAHKPLLECFGDYSNPRFTDRYHAADRIKAALEAVEAALSPTPQPDAAPADATAWLIEFSEKVSRTPAYYGHTDEGLGETTDSLKAVRFARREDAQAIIDDIGWNEARPVEHMWADSKCCNDLSPEECAQVPDRHCDGLQPASPLPADDIVARLRLHQIEEGKSFFALWDEAANEIERLRASPLPAHDVVERIRRILNSRMNGAPNVNSFKVEETISELTAANLLRQSAIMKADTK